MWRTDSLEKTLMLGKIESRRRRGWERVRWLDGYEFEQTVGVGDGQGSLACCNPWGRKESDTTEWLNWTDWMFTLLNFQRYDKDQIISVIEEGQLCRLNCSLEFDVLFHHNSIWFLVDQIMIVLIFLCLFKKKYFISISRNLQAFWSPIKLDD